MFIHINISNVIFNDRSGKFGCVASVTVGSLTRIAKSNDHRNAQTTVDDAIQASFTLLCQMLKEERQRGKEVR